MNESSNKIDSTAKNGVRPEVLSLEELKKLLMPTNLWTRHIDNNIGLLITWLCLRIKLSARVLTISALAPVLIGTFGLFTFSSPWNLILFGISIQLGYIIDGADGSLARATGAASPYGTYLDQMIDFCALTIIGVGYTLFAARRFIMNPYVIFGCTAFFVTRGLYYAAYFLQIQFKGKVQHQSRSLIIRLLAESIDTGMWWFFLPFLLLTNSCWIPLTLISIVQAGYVGQCIRGAYRGNTAKY